MRILLASVLTLCFSLSISSCKKCEVCVVTHSATSEDGDGTGTDEVYRYPEVCGTKKDLKAYTDLCRIENEADSEFKCTCEED